MDNERQVEAQDFVSVRRARAIARRRDTNAYYAAMCLLTSTTMFTAARQIASAKDGIEFGYAVLKNTSAAQLHALFLAARDLCDKMEAVTMADLAEPGR